MTMTAIPALSRTSATFRAEVDTFFASRIPTFVTEANALQADVDAKSASATASALSAAADAITASAAAATVGASVWVSGTTYALGVAVYSPIDLQSYRRKIAGAGTTDPSLDGTNWTRVMFTPTKVVTTLTSGTTWTCPAGVTSVTVHVQGGGGGGMRTTTPAIAGGGAGGYARHTFACVPATIYTISIGAGGSAAGADDTSGSSGSATTFNTGAVTVTGSGGSGALISEFRHAIGGAATNGDINVRGGHGTGATMGGGSVSRGGDSVFGSGGYVGGSSTAASGYGAGGHSRVNGAAADAGTQGCIVLEY